MSCIFSASCLLASIFFLLCSCRVDCYGRDSLKQGEWITDNGTTLVSSGRTFELGFFTPIRSSTHERFIGIWYKKDKQTVVWVANRDSPVLKGSTGTFGIADGNLNISDTTGKYYWSAFFYPSSTSRTVKLMDSGNLVLSNDDQFATSVWESFRDPTDTFLRGMKMDDSLMLTSWKNDSDPRSGQFTLKKYKEEEDTYVIKSTDTGLDSWRSTLMLSDFLSFDEMLIDITNLLSNFSGYVCRKRSSFYSRCLLDSKDERLVMDYTGELQYLKWDVDNGNWSLIWREPKDKCSIYNACGKFGSCNINNRVVCKCLPGFHPTIPKIWDSGNFLDGCTRSLTSFDNSDMFLNLKMMKVSNPEPSLNYYAKNETECRKQCLNFSQCQAYSYYQNCLILTGDLSNLC